MSEAAEIITMNNQNNKQERMNAIPKAVIMGAACVIFSSLTPEEVDRFKAYRPESLILVDEEREEIFTLDIDDGPGNLSNEKAVLSRAKSAEGKATITIVLDPEAEDKLDLVKKKLGPAMLRLEALENQLLGMTGDLEETETRIKSMFSQL